MRNPGGETDQIICVLQKPQAALYNLSYVNKVSVLQILPTNNWMHLTVLEVFRWVAVQKDMV